MKLIIIEGAGKKETIEKYLGTGYKVFATKGHIRDLPQKSLAVNVAKNFEPNYVIMEDKESIVSSLKSMAGKADEILLATDPDREGEAISWHLAHILGLDAEKKVRIAFHEISKKAVNAALEAPRPIDQNLVDAQQARRVLDRLVGYKVSPVLCKKISSKLSAGRVQSVTLRQVVLREREIRAFVPEEYWPFFSILEGSESSPFKATLTHKAGDKYKITSKELIDSTLADLEGAKYTVASVKRSITKSRPPAPFITSSLQQDALNKLGLSLKQTQAAAQALYEGVELPNEGKVALVTYIRTDSVRVAPDAINSAREYIGKTYGDKYLPAKPNVYTSKKSAQDAHEAIRPIDITRTPESVKSALPPVNYKLYKLIYERFLASQMADAEYNSLVVEIKAQRSGAPEYGFRVNGRTPLFDGYTVLYSAYQEKKDDDEDDSNIKLPDLKEGEVLKWIEYKYEQKFTRPPSRYTEASLVKLMEEKGIGRPATYTPTITVLFSREYTVKEKKYIVPTELGESVTDMLVKYFPEIMEIEFTANMETKLDTIEDGGVVWQNVVGEFYGGLEDKIKAALGDEYSLKAPPVPTDHVCEECSSPMVIREGRYGKFLSCTGFPKCRNLLNFDPETGEPVKKAPPELSEEKCEKCGSVMAVKMGKYGKFLGCTGYPKCKNIKNIEGEGGKPDATSDDANAPPLPPCPLCSKDLKVIKSFRGEFFGCTGYPECKFTSNARPTEGKCPDCESFLVIRKTKAGETIKCGDKNCSWVKE
ncbi:MAG: type I DNA topoisomerase [Firmicutes bacterium]|nr:type I DNA topoisomerase [Bacillota bacterium]